MKPSRRRGGAAIEFALILPVLVTLLFGIIEYGWVFLQQANVVAAVREGVRLGVTYATDDTPAADDAATARVTSVLNQYGFDASTATISAAYSGASPNMTLTVTAVVPYQPLIGFLYVPANLTGSMTMLLEQQD
jgi:Flp pilus assembly protein TadG